MLLKYQQEIRDRGGVGSGAGGVTLEAAENDEDGVAYSDFSHTVQAAGVTDLLAGGVFIRATNWILFDCQSVEYLVDCMILRSSQSYLICPIRQSG